MTLSIMAFHSEDGKPKFATDPDVYVPMEGGVASVEWLAEYLDNMNNFFRNGIAPVCVRVRAVLVLAQGALACRQT